MKKSEMESANLFTSLFSVIACHTFKWTMSTRWEQKQIETTMREMLTDRGFSNILLLNDAPFDGADGGIMMKGEDETNETCVVMIHKEKLGVKNLRDIAEKKGRGVLIILTSEKPTPPALRHLQLPEVVKWCSVFVTSEVIRNVTRHHLVPRHTRVDPSDLLSLLERWREKDISHLPLILVTDPVAKYLGLREGEVVFINGPDGTQTNQFNYRRAVCPSF